MKDTGTDMRYADICQFFESAYKFYESALLCSPIKPAFFSWTWTEILPTSQVNPDMVPEFENAGLKFVARDDTGKRMEVWLKRNLRKQFLFFRSLLTGFTFYRLLSCLVTGILLVHNSTLSSNQDLQNRLHYLWVRC
jgi:hypothetical protein